MLLSMRTPTPKQKSLLNVKELSKKGEMQVRIDKSHKAHVYVCVSLCLSLCSTADGQLSLTISELWDTA